MHLYKRFCGASSQKTFAESDDILIDWRLVRVVLAE